MLALSLGNAYMNVPGLRDLDQAERWYQHSLDLRAEAQPGRPGQDPAGHWESSPMSGSWRPAPPSAAEPVLLGHLNAALAGYQQALDLFPADDAENLAGIHNQLGNIYDAAGDTRQALHHYQQSIEYQEARGDIYGAGLTRYNIALLLRDAGRPGDALHYARAALHDFERTGPGAAQEAADARELIARPRTGTAGKPPGRVATIRGRASPWPMAAGPARPGWVSR